MFFPVIFLDCVCACVCFVYWILTVCPQIVLILFCCWLRLLSSVLIECFDLVGGSVSIYLPLLPDRPCKLTDSRIWPEKFINFLCDNIYNCSKKTGKTFDSEENGNFRLDNNRGGYLCIVNANRQTNKKKEKKSEINSVIG